MTRQRLLTLVVLGIAVSVVSPRCEATSQRLHVIAHVTQQTVIGDPARPQLGDRSITNVDLFDESGTRVGMGGASCTIVSVPPLDTLEECLAGIAHIAEFASSITVGDKGHARSDDPAWEPFHEFARGEVPLTVRG